MAFVGAMALDFLARADGPVQVGFGGCAPNAACVLRSLGERAHLLAPRAGDLHDIVETVLGRVGVEFESVGEADLLALFTATVTGDGDVHNERFHGRETFDAIAVSAVRGHLRRLEPALIIGCTDLDAATLRCLRDEAVRASIPFWVAVAGADADDIRKLDGLDPDHVAMSAGEYALWQRLPDRTPASELTPGASFALSRCSYTVTFGASGAVNVGTDGRITLVQAPPIDVTGRLTLGAGDAFVAGLASAWLHGRAPAEGVSMAVRVATAFLRDGRRATELDCALQRVLAAIPQVEPRSR